MKQARVGGIEVDGQRWACQGRGGRRVRGLCWQDWAGLAIWFVGPGRLSRLRSRAGPPAVAGSNGAGSPLHARFRGGLTAVSHSRMLVRMRGSIGGSRKPAAVAFKWGLGGASRSLIGFLLAHSSTRAPYFRGTGHSSPARAGGLAEHRPHAFPAIGSRRVCLLHEAAIARKALPLAR